MSKKMLSLKINLSKIDKTVLFKSAKTGNVYLDAIVFVNDEPDQYGNDGAVVQSYDKDNRPEKPLYIGNVKVMEAEKPAESAPIDEDNDLPF